jgi:hypothetical protein
MQADTKLALCFKVDQNAPATFTTSTTSPPIEATISLNNENTTADASFNANGFSFQFNCGAAS